LTPSKSDTVWSIEAGGALEVDGMQCRVSNPRFSRPNRPLSCYVAQRVFLSFFLSFFSSSLSLSFSSSLFLSFCIFFLFFLLFPPQTAGRQDKNKSIPGEAFREHGLNQHILVIEKKHLNSWLLPRPRHCCSE